MELDAVVRERLEKDAEFQNSLSALSDEEKEKAISEKKQAILNEEFESREKKIAESEQKFNDQRTRAEKAEEKLKKLSPKEPSKDSGLSPEDALHLAKSDVHAEDLSEVVDFARFKKLDIKEALKHPTLKSILRDKAEERRTAEATRTKGGAPNKSSSPDELINKAKQGQVAESDIEALVEAEKKARIGQKR